MEERRKFVRVKGLEEVSYKICGESRTRTAIVKDLSLVGINLYAQEAMEKDTELQMMFDLPSSPEKLIIQGRVIWQLSSHNERYATGIRFELADGPAKQTLGKFIQDCANKIDESREFVRCRLDTEVNFSLEHDPGTRRLAKSEDISRGGMKILAKENLEQGAKINLAFGFPGDIDLLRMTGKVVWVRPVEGRGYEVGLIFIKVEEEDKQRIWRFIERYCRKQQRTGI